ncbi:MAG: transposase [Tannerella sp.]|nr:transposase [Tannerella sp.]
MYRRRSGSFTESPTVLRQVSPDSVSKYHGIHTKPDRIDAGILAPFGMERSPAEWKPLSKHFSILRQLMRERSTLIQTRTQAMNHLHAYAHQGRLQRSSIKRCRQMIEVINRVRSPP